MNILPAASNRSGSSISIGYLIAAHAHPQQLRRLINGLNDPNGHVYIHLDAKSDVLPFLKAAPETSRVTYLKNRVRIFWGSFSQVEASLALLRQASKRNHDYYLHMSGADYPIRSVEELHDFLGSKNQEHIGMKALDYSKERPTRLEHVYIPSENYKSIRMRLLNRAMWLLPRRDVKKGLLGHHPHNGSSWWGLTHACVRYVLNFVDQNPSFVEFFSRTKHPDEYFYQTVVAGSPFAGRVQSRHLTFMAGQRDGPLHPAVLNRDDMEAMRESGKFFARKFDYNRDPEFYDLVDSELRSMTPALARSRTAAGRLAQKAS